MSKSVDVTITVAGANATDASNATANATAANATAASATAAPAAATTADAAPADTAAAPVKKGPPMIFWIWGGYSIWVHLTALLTWNAYGTYATNVVAAKVTNNTNWTTSWVKSTRPVKHWIRAANVTMFLQTFSIIGWILGILKMNDPFILLFKISQIFPALEVLMWMWAYFSYSSCDGNTLTATQFDKTTTTVTQLVSCKNPDKTTTTKAQFGTSGTWAAKVNTDPYNTWFFVDVGTAAGYMAVNGIALPAILKAYDKNASNASNATNATNATAPAAASASDATSSGSNASAVNASAAKGAAAAKSGDAKKSGGDGIFTVPDLIVDDVEKDNVIAIEEDRKKDDKKEEAEEECNSWWGCL